MSRKLPLDDKQVEIEKRYGLDNPDHLYEEAHVLVQESQSETC